MRARSLADLFLRRVEATPDALAYQFRGGEAGWSQLSWSQTAERVRAIAHGLRALGVEREQRCAIISQTRIEWILADLATLCSGAAVTTVYPTGLGEECAHILSDSESVIAFAEDATQVSKLAQHKHALPRLRKVVVFEGQGGHDGWVMSLPELEALGRAHERAHPAAFERLVRSIEPGQLATLIYTSGSTGQPKGVELIHDCWLYQGPGISESSTRPAACASPTARAT